MNVFARKPKTTLNSVDELNRKKYAIKVLDLKKDLNSRLKYLKSFIESTDNIVELKQFFDANYSQIYFIVYESFINAETNIKKSSKINKEELETILYVFQKILILQPERLHQRWQVRSIGRIIQKLLHVKNTKFIKFYGIRLFLIWYQILNTNKTHVEELMFQKLIQGFDTFHSSIGGGSILNSSIGIDMLNAEAQNLFKNQFDMSSSSGAASAYNSSVNNSIARSIYPFEITPVVPVQPNEQQYGEQQTNQSQLQQQQQQSQINANSVYSLTAEMLRKMLEYMQQDCLIIEWNGDKLQQSKRCYEFLFEEFKRFYLAYMFPSAFIINSVRHLQYNTSNHHSTNNSSTSTSVLSQQQSALNVYSNLDLLVLLNEQSMPTFERPLALTNMTPSDERKLAQLNCKEEIIKWLISVLLIDSNATSQSMSSQSTQISSSVSTSGLNVSVPTNVSSSSTTSNNNNNSNNMRRSDDVFGSSTTIATLTSGFESTNSHMMKATTNPDDLYASQNDFEANLFDSSFSGSTSQSISSFSSYNTIAPSASNMSNTPSQNVNKHLIQEVILSTMSNVNLIHEILKNAYFLNFDDNTTVQRVLNTYKKWFLKEAKAPSFMQEPIMSNTMNEFDSVSQISTSINMDDDKSNWSAFSDDLSFNVQHRSASISSSVSFAEQTKIGHMKCLQIFFFHSSNLLLNRTNLHRDRIKNICCYTLEIYKLFIRRLKMDTSTWTLLINILLRVAEFLLNSDYLINNRNDPSTSQLIKLITETVLMAIIKASFHFHVNIDIWDQLMHLLASFNSNLDVVDKWIEVIDDLIRQVIKAIYNIDINNLPVNESSLEQKRKLKKRIFNNSTSTSNNNIANNTVITNGQTSTNTPLISNANVTNLVQQQSTNQAQLSKPRARTEIYSTSGTSQLPSTPINTTPLAQTSSTNPVTKISNANQMNANQPPPLLTRQRNLTTTEMDSVKSPSLSEEHFLAINNQQQTTPLSDPKLASPSSKSEPNDKDDLDDEEIVDKSATLKATNVNNENTCIGNKQQQKQPSPLQTNNNPSNKSINRVNSDKSIYYSSELLNDNNTSSNLNESSNDSSGNNSHLNTSLMSSPTHLSANASASAKTSPQTTTTPTVNSQQPPPLPPLPASLVSKYMLNSKLYQIESLNEPMSKPTTDNLDYVDSTLLDSRGERKLKGISGEFDGLFKDFVNGEPPQIDTLSSDAASMSGGELSGDTYASPCMNTESTSIQSSIDLAPIMSDMTNSSSSLLLQTVTNAVNQNESLNSTTSVNTMASSIGTSPGLNISENYNSELLSIDSRGNQDERSASFIQGETSKSSTLTMTNDYTPHQPQAQNNRQSICNILPNENTNSIANQSQQIPTENTFKDIAYILIKRLVGCLGNMNSIKDPLVHKKIFEFISTKWEKLGKIKDDLKLSDLSQAILPLSHFAPLLFEAVYQLSMNYHYGKLIAYKTICRMAIRSAYFYSSSNQNDFDYVSDEFMDLFYMTVHHGLRSNDKNVINCIIQICGTRFWHCMLPSCTLLLNDFIEACSSVDNQSCKADAASILGCFICFPDYFGDLKVLGNSPQQQSDDNLSIVSMTKEELKIKIVQSLTTFSDDYTNTNSRAIVLCALTCFIYDEILNHKWNHQLLNEAIKRIFKDLDFREQFNPTLVKMSCDNLRFLSILASIIFQNEIQYAINIINELNTCLVKLINTKPPVINDEYEKAIIANMFALLEWCMNMPLDQLKDQDRATLLRNNFKLISHIYFTFKSNDSIESEHIHLSAKFIIQHLLNQLNHFPFGSAGPTKIVSSVNETSDLHLEDDLSPVLFEQPNIQFFTVNNQFLISFIELPMKNNEKYFNINSDKLKPSQTICRFVVRDFCGKNCWDGCLLRSPDENQSNKCYLDISSFASSIESRNSEERELKDSDSTKQLGSLANKDILDEILELISNTSPECRMEAQKPLNSVWDLNSNLKSILNIEDVNQKMINQISSEQKYSKIKCEAEIQALKNKMTNKDATKTHKEDLSPSNSNSNTANIQSHFHLCKSFIHQMGLLSWEKRHSFNLLHKSPQLLRELKSLDDQTCRETHKMAIIYIAEGQEEKSSILSNENGSQDYDDFMNALAWQVELDKHEGFMGGLQHNYQLKTAPYYANSICEVLFHVSTQMNIPNDQNKISKWRHLGNDSVQIIWSEHTKDYDRSILATEFADVIICIYPLRNGLFRIQIIKKPSVGYFGPLFDGAIINKQSLPTLIRATAINASRVLLSNTKGYKDFFVHRSHVINNVIKTLTEKQTSEQFIADIYSPAALNTNTTSSLSTATPSSAVIGNSRIYQADPVQSF